PFDGLAIELHKEYQKFSENKNEEGKGEYNQQRDNTKAPWDMLLWKYKQSNRRQARHLPAKLHSRGIVRVTDMRANYSQPVPGIGINFGPGVMLCNRDTEALSELEHRSWMVGNYLEGWRAGESWAAGERIDARMMHDCLVDYDQLENNIQQYDRENIALTNRFLLMNENRSTVDEATDYRNDVWVGIIGAVLVREPDINGLYNFIDKTVTDLVNQLPDYHFTLVSPLAPGVDIFAMHRAIRILKDKHIPCRIIVPQAVPLHVTVKSYNSAYDDSVRWVPTEFRTRIDTTADWEKNSKQVEQDVQNAIVKLMKDCPGSRFLNIEERDIAFNQSNDRQRGYQRQAAYICRSHILVTAQCSSKRKPGGTAETLAWWKGEVGIPRDLGNWRQRPNNLGGLHKRVYEYQLGGCQE
ncbi:RyR domain-containing protein, partial [Crocinitomicaceae bacterium]|nr:RyR domain-containing protein [Crocinitomicaceae bacterium]